MKKLKFLAFLMMGIVACFGMTSCGDDDDDDDLGNASIVGKWQVKYYDEDCGNVVETVEFKSNGTCYTEHKCQDPEEGVVKSHGTYTVAGDLEDGAYLTMRLEFDDEPGYWETSTYVARRQGKTLILANSYGETITFNRI